MTGLRSPVKGRLCTDTLAESSVSMWVVEPEKCRSAIAERPIHRRSSRLSGTAERCRQFLPTPLGSMWSTELSRIKRSQRSRLRWEGCLWRRSTSHLVQRFSAALWLYRVKSCSAARFALSKQLWHTRVSTNPCNLGTRYRFKKCTAAVLAGLQRGRKGACEAPWVGKVLASI